LVNDAADTLGVAAAELLAAVDDPPAELDEELELDDELPHAATAMLAATASATTTDLLLSKCTLNPSLSSVRDSGPDRSDERPLSNSRRKRTVPRTLWGGT